MVETVQSSLMTRRGFLFGTLSYLLLTCFIFPFLFGIPSTLFVSDDASYNSGAIHLLQQGFLSLDGIHAYMDREPGQSVLLAVTYAIFGVENVVGIYLVQGILLYISAFLFAQSFGKHTSLRVGAFTFFLLLTSGSVLHTVFVAVRECLALSLLLLFGAVYCRASQRLTLQSIIAMSVLMASTILTYYSFVYFPIALALLWLVERRPTQCILAFLVVTYVLVGLWAYRNFVALGDFSVIDGRRSNVAWFIRGEQAVNIHGVEPLRCLWAEYVSRDWSMVSPSCSFNAVMHRHWPNDFLPEVDYTEDGREGLLNIWKHPISYLWFSVIEIIELHFPYVGGGWSTRFHVYALLTQVFLGMGFLAGVRWLRHPIFHALLLFIAYNTLVFILTDATPRYMLPVFFCYTAIAAIGYDNLLHRILRSS